MPPQRPLDYEPVDLSPPPFWRRNRVLWAAVCFIGYGFAVIGPFFVAAGIVTFYADPSGSLQTRIVGVPVQTVTERVVWTLSNVLIGVIGLCFVASAPLLQAFRRRGMTRHRNGPSRR